MPEGTLEGEGRLRVPQKMRDKGGGGVTFRSALQ